MTLSYQQQPISKVLIKSTTKLSLHERFSQIQYVNTHPQRDADDLDSSFNYGGGQSNGHSSHHQQRDPSPVVQYRETSRRPFDDFDRGGSSRRYSDNRPPERRTASLGRTYTSRRPLSPVAYDDNDADSYEDRYHPASRGLSMIDLTEPTTRSLPRQMRKAKTLDRTRLDFDGGKRPGWSRGAGGGRWRNAADRDAVMRAALKIKRNAIHGRVGLFRRMLDDFEDMPAYRYSGMNNRPWGGGNRWNNRRGGGYGGGGNFGYRRNNFRRNNFYGGVYKRNNFNNPFRRNRFNGGGGNRWRRGGGGYGNRYRKEEINKDDLDAEIDAYMSKTKGYLDRQLDDYHKQQATNSS